MKTSMVNLLLSLNGTLGVRSLFSPQVLHSLRHGRRISGRRFSPFDDRKCVCCSQAKCFKDMERFTGLCRKEKNFDKFKKLVKTYFFREAHAVGLSHQRFFYFQSLFSLLSLACS